MSPVEAISPWISSPAPITRPPRRVEPAPRDLARPAFQPPESAAGRPESAISAPSRMRVGAFSLRQIVDAAVAEAEGLAIRRALLATHGNKSQAARLLRTNYTTLHAKMRRYGIPARASQS